MQLQPVSERVSVSGLDHMEHLRPFPDTIPYLEEQGNTRFCVGLDQVA